MFNGATSFNQNIGGWDTSSVKFMNGMFERAAAFNQDIGGWNVTSVATMTQMFRSATSFNQDISGWNITSVEFMIRMFEGATSFTQDLCPWKDAPAVVNNQDGIMFLGSSGEPKSPTEDFSFDDQCAVSYFER